MSVSNPFGLPGILNLNDDDVEMEYDDNSGGDNGDDGNSGGGGSEEDFGQVGGDQNQLPAIQNPVIQNPVIQNPIVNAPGDSSESKEPVNLTCSEYLNAKLQEVYDLGKSVSQYSVPPDYHPTAEELRDARFRSVNLRQVWKDYDSQCAERKREIAGLEQLFAETYSSMEARMKRIIALEKKERRGAADFVAAEELQKKNEMKTETIQLKRVVGRIDVVSRREKNMEKYYSKGQELKKVKVDLGSVDFFKVPDDDTSGAGVGSQPSSSNGAGSGQSHSAERCPGQ